MSPAGQRKKHSFCGLRSQPEDREDLWRPQEVPLKNYLWHHWPSGPLAAQQQAAAASKCEPHKQRADQCPAEGPHHWEARVRQPGSHGLQSLCWWEDLELHIPGAGEKVAQTSLVLDTTSQTWCSDRMWDISVALFQTETELYWDHFCTFAARLSLSSWNSHYINLCTYFVQTY